MKMMMSTSDWSPQRKATPNCVTLFCVYLFRKQSFLFGGKYDPMKGQLKSKLMELLPLYLQP